MTNKWPDGTPKSIGNAFDWRGQPSIFTTKSGQRLSLLQVIDHATRINREATLGFQGGVIRRVVKGGAA